METVTSNKSPRKECKMHSWSTSFGSDSESPTLTSPVKTTDFLSPSAVKKSSRSSLTPYSSTPRPSSFPSTPMISPINKVPRMQAFDSPQSESSTPILSSPISFKFQETMSHQSPILPTIAEQEITFFKVNSSANEEMTVAPRALDSGESFSPARNNIERFEAARHQGRQFSSEKLSLSVTVAASPFRVRELVDQTKRIVGKARAVQKRVSENLIQIEKNRAALSTSTPISSRTLSEHRGGEAVNPATATPTREYLKKSNHILMPHLTPKKTFARHETPGPLEPTQMTLDSMEIGRTPPTSNPASPVPPLTPQLAASLSTSPIGSSATKMTDRPRALNLVMALFLKYLDDKPLPCFVRPVYCSRSVLLSTLIFLGDRASRW